MYTQQTPMYNPAPNLTINTLSIANSFTLTLDSHFYLCDFDDDFCKPFPTKVKSNLLERWILSIQKADVFRMLYGELFKLRKIINVVKSCSL